MQTWIALLRGINVGGNNILPMKDLRALLGDFGLRNIRTYIQSGNCIFDCDGGNAQTLAGKIADGIEARFGFRPKVIVITMQEMEAAIAGNPYPEGVVEPKSVNLYFFSEPADEADLGALAQIQRPGERFWLTDRVFYLHAPEGFGRSKLASQAEKFLRVPVTARNLRSVIRIADLAR